MKNSIGLGIVLSGIWVSAWAQTFGPTGPGAPGATLPPDEPQYRVVERGPNHRVWQRLTYAPGPFGPVPIVHRYCELGTAIHHLVRDRWADCSPQIQITPTGGQATNCQHSVAFSGNLNTAGAVDVVLPEGAHLTANILGLSYSDSSGKSVMIAQVKDADGILLPAGNEVLFRDAFSGVLADVRYLNSILGTEQLVVLREQLPPPSAWGLDPASTVLEVITEFLNPPKPGISLRSVGSRADEHLSFGTMQMGWGKAFALGSETNSVPVTKQWLLMEGRTCLVEQVPLSAIRRQLELLPAPASGSASLRPAAGAVLLGKAGNRSLPQPRLAARPASGSLKLAARREPAQGLALDWSLLSSQPTLRLQSDQTYLVAQTVNVSDTLTVEGGAITKFTNSASASIVAGNVVCTTGPARIGVFSSIDDNSIGEAIPGSTGDPTQRYYGGIALDLSVNFGDSRNLGSGPVLSNLRFCYLGAAVCGSGLTLRHCQVSRCNVGFAVFNAAGQEPLPHPTLYNVLWDRVNTVVDSDGLPGDLLVGVNVTAHSCPVFMADGTSTIWLTNCLFAAVSNWHCFTTYTNSSAFLDSDAGVFQTVGAGAHYLADSSPYRDAGTADIDPTLLSELAQKTTYPPLVYSNATISTDAVFSPQAQRDTDQPDLGFHYTPIDYAFGGCDVNANVSFPAGTAVAWFRTSSGWYHAGHGIHLGGGYQLSFNGTATAPTYWVRYNAVQEQANNNWSGGVGIGGITSWTGSAPFPVVQMRFTRCISPANESNFVADDYGSMQIHLQDCELYGGGLGYYCNTITLTNGLLDRSWVYLHGGVSPNYYVLRNCTFHGGGVDIERWPEYYGSPGTGWVPVTMLDCAFDGTSISTADVHSSDTNWTRYDYSFYLAGAQQTSPAGAHDQTVTRFNWQTNWLGDYYLPGGSALKNADLDRTADQVGLYHYTTQTNFAGNLQEVEGFTRLDIGYHYVAVNSSGNPLDSDGDGIPDYLEDSNGDGTYDSGDRSDWLTYDSPNGLSNGTGLQVFTPLQ